MSQYRSSQKSNFLLITKQKCVRRAGHCKANLARACGDSLLFAPAVDHSHLRDVVLPREDGVDAIGGAVVLVENMRQLLLRSVACLGESLRRSRTHGNKEARIHVQCGVSVTPQEFFDRSALEQGDLAQLYHEFQNFFWEQRISTLKKWERAKMWKNGSTSSERCTRWATVEGSAKPFLEGSARVQGLASMSNSGFVDLASVVVVTVAIKCT